MGYSASAYVVIGISLTRVELSEKRRVKRYNHCYPDDYNVDPKTGSPLYSEYEVCKLTGTEDFNIPENDYKIEMMDDGSDRSPTYYIGTIMKAGDGRFLPITSDLKGSLWFMADKIRDILEPKGLWFPQRYGIYPVLYEGY